MTMAAHYQYIFIGSGVAAVTVATRLLEKDRSTSILMLEAGPKVATGDRRSWWDYIQTGRKPYDFCYDVQGENKTISKNPAFKWGFEGARIMAYGGSTGHWGAWSVRYKPEDFQLRTNTGEGADWPIAYEDLEAYYLQAEHYLSVCGDTSESWNQHRASSPYPRPDFGWTAADGLMIEGFRKSGIEPGKMPIARYRKCMATGTCKYCPIGSRYTAQGALDDLVDDPRHTHFEQRCLSPVTRLIAGKKSRIDAVEYVDSATGENRTVTGDTIVVCAGTYESPKLLTRSTSPRWKNGIGNDHDLVGRFIVSHSFLRVNGTIPSNKKCWVQEFDFPTLMSRSFDTPEQQLEGKIFLFKNRIFPNTDIAQLMTQGKTRKEIRQVLAGPMTFELQAFYEEKGQFGNRLVARSGTNRFGLPLMDIEYNRDPRFDARAKSRLALMQPVLEAMDAKDIKTTVNDPGGHHASGTCRMAETPEEGVTDKHMKVFGTDNLFVCSNAAFPTCSAVNPTLTLTALSMRLGDYLVASVAGKSGKEKTA
jgi:choline dehydrogenase-like flavoprotein